MSTAGITMVKDEADVIAGTLRHMATQVDFLIVADNGSTDGTSDILADLRRDLPLTVVRDAEVAYYQSHKMTALAGAAAAGGAEWIVPFDADELWHAPAGGRIADFLASSSARVVAAELLNHFCTALDGPDPDPFVAMPWRSPDRAGLGKVAFRWSADAVIAQGNHAVSFVADPGSELGEYWTSGLQVRHFPYRSARQFVRKARNGSAAYRAAADLPETDGAHWRGYGDILDRHGESALAEVFREHFWYLRPAAAGLVHDPAPYKGR